MRCYHPGCTSVLVVECTRTASLQVAEVLNYCATAGLSVDISPLVEHYCVDHCLEHGYCWKCGEVFNSGRISEAEGVCVICMASNLF